MKTHIRMIAACTLSTVLLTSAPLFAGSSSSQDDRGTLEIMQAALKNLGTDKRFWTHEAMFAALGALFAHAKKNSAGHVSLDAVFASKLKGAATLCGIDFVVEYIHALYDEMYNQSH